MRNIVEPPSSSQCGRCGGALKLKRTEPIDTVLGLRRTLFCCVKCGSEHAFVGQRDLYASSFHADRRLTRA